MLSMHKCLSSRQRIAALFVSTLVSLVSGPNALAGTSTNTVSFEYDSVTGLLKAEVREPDNAQLHLRTEYTYDKFGNRLTTVVSSNATGIAAIPTHTARSLTYDAAGVSPQTVTNALGQTVNVRFDSSNLPLYIQGLNGLASSFTYDPFGRKISERRPDGTQTKWEYLICGGTVVCPSQAKFVTRTTHYASDGTTVNGPWAKVYLDEFDRKVRTETVAFDGATVITSDTEYDSLGRIARASRPYYPNATIHWTTTSYDELGRPVTVVAPDGAQTTMAYDGLTTVVTNALNQTQTTVKNGIGKVAQVVDAQGNTLSYAYDAQGNLLQTTDPKGNVIAMSYDSLGRKESMSDPDLGLRAYEHDALGRLRRQVDPKGNVTTISYDVLGRVLGRTEADLVSAWTYDTCYKGKGRLCRSTANSGYTVDYSFDDLGRPSQTTTQIDTTYTTTNTYDVQGRLATVTYPTGVAVKYVYSALGYLKEVRDNATNGLYWQANALDAEGRLLQQTYGNALVTQTVFDPETGRVQNIRAGAGNAVQNLTYSHDPVGNLVTRGDANQNLAETFLYDELNRLTSNTVNSSGAGLATQSYTYDSIGNITGRSDMGAYTYGSTSRPHAVATIDLTNGGARAYDYDANGNLISEAERDSAGNVLPSKGRVHSYTSFNMPLSLSNASSTLNFVYGPEHQRIKQISPTGTTIYLHPDNSGGLSYEKEIKSDGSVEHKHFISARSGIVGVVKLVAGIRTILYFHRDHLGSTTAVTNQAGELVERMAYEPFGKRRTIAGATGPNDDIVGSSTDRGYTNHEHLDELGLIHMNGRVYDPATGRFTSADPQIPSPLNIQSFNRYSYTRNNPLMMTDPNGFQEAVAGEGGCGWDLICWLSGGGGGGGDGGVDYSNLPEVSPETERRNAATAGGSAEDGNATVQVVGQRITSCTQLGSCYDFPAMGSAVADFVPFIGTGKSIVEVATGRDPITGEVVDRGWAAVGIFASLIPGGKGAVNAGKLAFDRASRQWVSQAGLRYGYHPTDGNRLKHVLRHMSADPEKSVHTVFNVPRQDIVALLDEAWSTNPKALLDDPRAYIIDMGRQIGTQGETHLRMVVKQSGEVVTAYPTGKGP